MMTRPKLMFLAHRLPYPPDKGDKIRAWHVLEHLVARHDVLLGTFVDDPADMQHLGLLKQVCAEVFTARQRPSMLPWHATRAILSGRSITMTSYRDAGLAEWVRAASELHRPDRLFVYSGAMAQYAPMVSARRRVIDFCDVDSAKWDAYAKRKRWPARVLYAYEARTLLAAERKAAVQFDACLLSSQIEVELFRRVAPEAGARALVMGNGVDLARFAPDPALAKPRKDAPHIVFTGMMDYWPNVDAVVWFVNDIWPRVRAILPEARFFIVGAKPDATVRALADAPGVVVTGRVPDVRPYLAGASAVVAPLRVARGVQNKVLEAMAMARPVVATPAAMQGVRAEAGTEVLVAADAAGFADTLVSLLRHGAGEALGQAGRRRVEQDHSWASALTVLDAVLESGDPAALSASQRR